MAGIWRDISAGGTGDLLDPVSDDVTHDLVGQRRGGSEPDGSLGQLEGRQPVAHRVDDPGTERKDAEMMLGSQKSEQRLLVVLKRGHPVARALLGLGHDLYHQVADVLESVPRGCVEAVEVVIYGWHGRNDTRSRCRESELDNLYAVTDVVSAIVDCSYSAASQM